MLLIDAPGFGHAHKSDIGILEPATALLATCEWAVSANPPNFAYRLHGLNRWFQVSRVIYIHRNSYKRILVTNRWGGSRWISVKGVYAVSQGAPREREIWKALGGFSEEQDQMAHVERYRFSAPFRLSCVFFILRDESFNRNETRRIRAYKSWQGLKRTIASIAMR